MLISFVLAIYISELSLYYKYKGTDHRITILGPTIDLMVYKEVAFVLYSEQSLNTFKGICLMQSGLHYKEKYQ